MKRRIYGLLAAMCLVLVVTPVVRAADTIDHAVTGGNIRFDPETGTVTGCDVSVTAANIPDTIGGVSVTSIGYGAFSCQGGLTSVNIPDGVTSIGDSAFFECTGLTSIDIPSSVTSIGDGAFALCSGLTSVNIPNSVTSIGDNAFSGCSGLTSVNIPNSVTSIGDNAFYNCTSLTSVNIPNSVTSIGYGAFSGCSNLTSVNISNSVTSIDKVVFYGCSGLTSVNIPNSVTSIDNQAFAHCDGLTTVSIPNSVTSIGGDAFISCPSLTGITVAIDNPSFSSIDGVLFSKDATFLHTCRGTKSGAYSIPSSVTSIGDYAFGCTGLTTVSIPNGVTSIGYYAFWDCADLTDVYYDGTQAEYETKLLPNVDDSYSGNNRFLNATFHFKEATSPNPPSPNPTPNPNPNPTPNPTLPNTAASDNTALHGTLFLLLTALTLTVWALGRRKKDKQSN